MISPMPRSGSTQLARRAQANAERKARKDGAGKRKRARGDVPRIQLNTMKDRSEASGGDAARLAERRRTQALDDAAAARERIEVLQPLSVVLPSTGLPVAKTVLRVEAASVGFTTGRPVLRDLSFAIVGPERVAVTGANGSGKTTLLSLLTGRLAPWSGHGAGDGAASRCSTSRSACSIRRSRSATISGGSIPRPTRTPAAPRSPASCSAPMPPCRPCRA